MVHHLPLDGGGEVYCKISFLDAEAKEIPQSLFPQETLKYLAKDT